MNIFLKEKVIIKFFTSISLIYVFTPCLSLSYIMYIQNRSLSIIILIHISLIQLNAECLLQELLINKKITFFHDKDPLFP